MTAPLAKVDALAAARIAPWLELLAPKAPAAAGQAQPVLNAPRVDNELLLPARTGLHAGQSAAATHAAPAETNAERASSHTDLSAAARVIHGVLSNKGQGDAGPVRGSAPVWPASPQAPAADALAAALQQRVSESGMFYESHLAQFAAGLRSLAQMQREPQAAWLSPREAAMDEGAPAAQQRQSGALLSLAATPAPALAVSADAGAAPVAGAGASASQPVAQAPQAHGAATDLPQSDAGAGVQQQPPVQRAAESLFSPAEHAGKHSGAAAPSDRLAGQAVVSDTQPAANAAHPQASALVHQQLELLASSVFRWSGEAWPGVSMQWTVREEGARQHADENAADAQQGSWSTTVSLDLPRLGQVDLRLSLSGSSARAQLAAREPEALMQLRAHRAALSQRMAAAGFELRGLQMNSELAAS